MMWRVAPSKTEMKGESPAKKNPQGTGVPEE